MEAEETDSNASSQPKTDCVIYDNTSDEDNFVGDISDRKWEQPSRARKRRNKFDYDTYWSGSSSRSSVHSERDCSSPQRQCERIVRIVEEVDDNYKGCVREKRSYSRPLSEDESGSRSMHDEGWGLSGDWADSESNLSWKFENRSSWDHEDDLSQAGKHQEMAGFVEGDAGPLSVSGKGLISGATSLLQGGSITDPVIRKKFAKACLAFLKSSLQRTDTKHQSQEDHYFQRSQRPPYKRGRIHTYRRASSSRWSDSASSRTGFDGHSHPGKR